MQIYCPYCKTGYRISEEKTEKINGKPIRCIKQNCRQLFRLPPVLMEQNKLEALPPPLPAEIAETKETLRPNLIKKILITAASIFVAFLILFNLCLWLFGGKINRADIIGDYMNEDNPNPNAFLEIKENNQFRYSHGAVVVEGVWEFRDDKLIISPGFGPPLSWKVKRDKIIDDDGIVWTKMEEVVISKITILGRYISAGGILEIYKGGKFKYKGRNEQDLPVHLTDDLTGDWELDGKKLKLTTIINDAWGTKMPFLEGEISGKIFRINSGRRFVKET